MTNITRSNNIVRVEGDFGHHSFHFLLAKIYEAVVKKEYQDIILDFSKCTSAFPGPMAALCSLAAEYRKEKDTSFELLIPNDSKLARLFINTNYAHIIDPDQPPSKFRGYTKVPLTQYISTEEQASLVNKMIECILSVVESLSREDLAAMEWAINEITDNVLVHSESKVGGFAQLTTYGSGSNRSVEFVVCDRGVGIPSTLRPSHPEIHSDLEALEYAIKEGVTRDKSIGQGNGLFGTFEICRVGQGYFHIHSGFGRLELNKRGNLRIVEEKFPLEDCLIIGRMDCSKQNVLQEALRFKGARHTTIDYIEQKYEAEDLSELNISIKNEASSVGSRPAGTPIRRKIIHLLSMCPDHPITLDFTEIPLVSSSFADEVIGKLFIELGPVNFMNKVHIKNASPTVKALIDRAIAQRLSSGI